VLYRKLKNNSEGETMSKMLQAGAPAPEFTLNVTPDQTLSLRELRGRSVILAFYPADWSPVCGDQMSLYNEILPEFRKYHAELLGISVDGVWCHAAFLKIVSCISHCFRISNPRVMLPGNTAFTARRVSANAHCSSSTRTASSSGVIVRRLP